MGMKKKDIDALPITNMIGTKIEDMLIPPVPNVPTLPKTSVAPKSDPNGVSPVAPTNPGYGGLYKEYATSDKGLGKTLAAKSASGDNMSKQDWADKDARISIDAIHKSTLESPTLANLAIGKNDDEVLALTRKFFKYQLETNQLAKRGEL